eukprot:TRINITY_DN3836_c0_g2_i3.p1 TRINITY_DN3836_c0_g2~~TRINITY_DN3836_c0_g2_i3.p1  ORF type:complete len:109 (-),score=9.99 TRINITY_DN3836_c0_g2_i3:767-1093(-)
MMFTVVIVLCSDVGAELSSLGIGFGLMILIFMGGHISGSHYNPAVTVGVYLSGRQKIVLQRAFFYIVMQIAGAIGGAGIAYGFFGEIIPPDVGPASTTGIGQLLSCWC